MCHRLFFCQNNFLYKVQIVQVYKFNCTSLYEVQIFSSTVAASGGSYNNNVESCAD